MELFESGLFMELGEVVGHDPTLYEDIPKQHVFNAISSADVSVFNNQMEQKSQFMGLGDAGEYLLQASDVGELDGLLAESNNLLEQLMVANGLDLSSDYIDLANIDELGFAVKSDAFTAGDGFLLDEYEHSLLSDLNSMAQSSSLDDDYPFADSPTSTISTLASEPSSPLDIAAMQYEQQQQYELASASSQQEPDLTNLLQSLGDVSSTSALGEPVDSIYYDTNNSLVDSGSADTSYFSQSAEHSDLSYNSGTCHLDLSVSNQSSLAPTTKVKTKKKKKSTPYSKLPAGRKERKKQQNKEAAIRYREKKRSEAQEVLTEEEQLAKRNNELKTDVLNLEREILCMKELLSDVFNIHSL